MVFDLAHLLQSFIIINYKIINIQGQFKYLLLFYFFEIQQNIKQFLKINNYITMNIQCGKIIKFTFPLTKKKKKNTNYIQFSNRSQAYFLKIKHFYAPKSLNHQNGKYHIILNNIIIVIYQVQYYRLKIYSDNQTNDYYILFLLITV